MIFEGTFFPSPAHSSQWPATPFAVCFLTLGCHHAIVHTKPSWRCVLRRTLWNGYQERSRIKVWGRDWL